VRPFLYGQWPGYAVDQASLSNKGLSMRNFIIVAVSVVVGIVLGYAAMQTYYNQSAPPASMKR
jgi:cell division protein FtsN